MKTGIGYSRKASSFEAGAEAAGIALEQVSEPSIAIAFASVDYNQTEILKGIHSRITNLPVLGCSSFAEISNIGVTTNSVVIALFKSDDCGVFTTFTDCMGDGLSTGRAAGKDLAEKLEHSPYGNSDDFSFVNLLFCDMNHAIGNDYIKGLREIYGCTEMTYFGGGSSWDRKEFQERGYVVAKEVFAEKEARSRTLNAAILALPKSKNHTISFGFSHGWTPVTGYHTVTKAIDNFIYEVDNKPVFEFYESILGEDFIERLKSLPGRYCFNVEYGTGTNTCSDIRNPTFFNKKEGAIGFFPPDPMSGTRFKMTYCTRVDLVKDARRAATDCLNALGPAKPQLVVMISCIARYDMLQSRNKAELEAVRDVFGKDVPIIGYYAGGEIGPLVSHYEEAAHTNCKGEIPLHHGVSLCLLALGSNDDTHADLEQFICSRAGNDTMNKDEELKRLRALLEITENYIDDSSEVLTSICIRNASIGEALKNAKSMLEIQNRKLLETNDENENLQDILKRYTPATIWKKASHSVEKGLFEIENEKVELTFLFLDVKGFTSYAENHEPDEVIAAINRIFEPVTGFIYERDGDIDKFIGDAILAIFPKCNGALRAAKKIVEFMNENGEKLAPFNVRIGINYGQVVMGNVGSHKRMDHTLIGDAVNLAQRLETACKPGRVLVSESVFTQAVMPFPNIEKKELKVKGKDKAVTAYECW